MVRDKWTYGEFLSLQEKIATIILADCLMTLYSYGFITERVALDKRLAYVWSDGKEDWPRSVNS